jgi:hypothetical protein
LEFNGVDAEHTFRKLTGELSYFFHFFCAKKEAKATRGERSWKSSGTTVARPTERHAPNATTYLLHRNAHGTSVSTTSIISGLAKIAVIHGGRMPPSAEVLVNHYVFDLVDTDGTTRHVEEAFLPNVQRPSGGSAKLAVALIILAVAFK